MDLRLLFAVLWRSKRLLLGGLGLGVALAVLSYGRPALSGGVPTIKPRGAEVWQSESQLLITQAGFPYRETAISPNTSLASLSPVYANVANGSSVQAEIRRRVHVAGKVKAAEAVDLAADTLLPFVSFVASSPTPGDARALASGAARVFQAYVGRAQVLSGVPPDHRIALATVQAATAPKLSEGHKLSIPILIFFAVLVAVVSLVLLKENARTHQAASAESAANGRAPQTPQPEQAPISEAPHAHSNGAPATDVAKGNGVSATDAAHENGARAADAVHGNGAPAKAGRVHSGAVKRGEARP